jgi:hypothetical protein
MLWGLVHSSSTHGLNSSHQRPQIASCFAAKAISCLMSNSMVAALARVPGLPWVHKSKQCRVQLYRSCFCAAASRQLVARCLAVTATGCYKHLGSLAR